MQPAPASGTVILQVARLVEVCAVVEGAAEFGPEPQQVGRAALRTVRVSLTKVRQTERQTAELLFVFQVEVR